MWRRLSYNSGDRIEEPHGIFFMSATDGSVEGWQYQDDELQFDPSYVATPGNRLVIASADEHDVLLHRETGTSIRWPKVYVALVGGFADTFVLQERLPIISSIYDYGQPAERLFVCSAANGNFRAEATFTLPDVMDAARSTVLALPGNHILLHINDYPQSPTALIVDVQSGDVTRLIGDPGAWIEDARVSEDGYIIATQGRGVGTPDQGWGVFVVDADRRTQKTFGAHAPSGQPMLSPDLRYALVPGDLRTVEVRSEIGSESWPEITLWDIDKAEALFRTRSATFSGGDFLSGPRWLADSSGFLAYTGPEPGNTDMGDVRTVLISLREGGAPEIEYLPYRPMVASPADPDLFATSHSSVYNRRSGDVFDLHASLGFSDFFSPWNGTSDEIVCVVPHGGHGGYEVGTLLAPHAELAPLSDAMRFAVAGTANCLNLRAKPGLAAEIRMCIPEGTVLELAVPDTPPHPDPDNRQPDEPHEGLATHRNGEDGQRFVHVREPGGATGWVAANYLRWADDDD